MSVALIARPTVEYVRIDLTGTIFSGSVGYILKEIVPWRRFLSGSGAFCGATVGHLEALHPVKYTSAESIGFSIRRDWCRDWAGAGSVTNSVTGRSNPPSIGRYPLVCLKGRTPTGEIALGLYVVGASEKFAESFGLIKELHLK